jgi:hypothetical protein
MAINPNLVSLITISDLPDSLNQALNWFVIIEDPLTKTPYKLTAQQFYSLINGNLSAPNGVLSGLDLSINNSSNPKVATFQQGQWRKDGIIYQINVVSNFNINAADATLNRIDSFYATESDTLGYIAGVESLTPFEPNIPADSIRLKNILVFAGGGAITVPIVTPVNYAVMNALNNGDLDITGAFKVNGIPFNGVPIIDGLTSGGVIDISDFANGNLPIGVSTWDFNGVGYSTNAITPFTGIALSSAGNQRYAAFFGTDVNTIIKVEGTESAAATLPNAPANSVLLSYVLITDAAVDAPVVDLSAFVTTNTNQNVGGEKNFTNDLSLTNAFLKTNRGIYFYDRIKDSSQPYTSVYPDFSFKSLANGSFKYGFFSSKLPNTQQLDLDYDRDTGLFDFKLRPTVNGSDIALVSEVALKLDISAYNDRFKGKYTTIANLQTAFPTANAGDYAQVDSGAGVDAINYNYDTEEGWIQGGSGSGATDTDQLLEGATNLYYTEARVTANTEVTANTAKRSYPSGDETKLGGIATGATQNVKATSAETITGTDDVKFTTAKTIFDWWANIKNIVVNITARWQFLGIGIGTAGVANTWLVLAASTSAIASFLVTFGASYTGTVEGSIWGETTGKRLKIFRNGVADDFLFKGVNKSLEGTGTAVAFIGADGSITRGAGLDEGVTLDSDIITALDAMSTTRATITPAASKIFRQGESYDNGTFTFFAYADNQVRRW